MAQIYRLGKEKRSCSSRVVTEGLTPHKNLEPRASLSLLFGSRSPEAHGTRKTRTLDGTMQDGG